MLSFRTTSRSEVSPVTCMWLYLTHPLRKAPMQSMFSGQSLSEVDHKNQVSEQVTLYSVWKVLWSIKRSPKAYCTCIAYKKTWQYKINFHSSQTSSNRASKLVKTCFYLCLIKLKCIAQTWPNKACTVNPTQFNIFYLQASCVSSPEEFPNKISYILLGFFPPALSCSLHRPPPAFWRNPGTAVLHETKQSCT